MTATTVFVIPKERLETRHPSEDHKRPENLELSKKLETLSGKAFVNSDFFPKNGKDWSFGKVDRDSYQDIQNKYLTAEVLNGTQPVSQIMSLIRNALAHGNILTDNGTIEKLVFTSERKDKTKEIVGYQFLVVPVRDFRDFLVLWLKFLAKERVECGAALRLLEAA